MRNKELVCEVRGDDYEMESVMSRSSSLCHVRVGDLVVMGLGHRVKADPQTTKWLTGTSGGHLVHPPCSSRDTQSSRLCPLSISSQILMAMDEPLFSNPIKPGSPNLSSQERDSWWPSIGLSTTSRSPDLGGVGGAGNMEGLGEGQGELVGQEMGWSQLGQVTGSGNSM